MRRVLLVAALTCVVSCGGDATAPAAPLNEQFDSFWSAFDQQYSYFVYKRVNWDSLRTVFEPRALAAATQNAFVDTLREMLAPLRDLHVRFITPGGSLLPTFTATTTPNWDRTLWTHVIAGCNYVQYRIDLGYCTMNGMAYISIGAWDVTKFSVADLDAVLDTFRNAPGMIIDVRGNTGGNDALSFPFAGRFTTETVTSGYTRTRNGPGHNDFGSERTRRVSPRGNFAYQNPVVVLAGRGSYSANESFVSAMREMENVTILGDTTGGASANPVTRSLAGGWGYTVSRWIEFTADHNIIEWLGIPPDVYVKWDPAIVAAGRDPIIDAAIAHLPGLVTPR